jgi:hypothetical protein
MVLVAGFAILCTILRPETMLALHRVRNKKYGLSELKLLFVIFVDVFVQFLALSFWSILVIVFGANRDPKRKCWMKQGCSFHPATVFSLLGGCIRPVGGARPQLQL